jgi:hypothetical protein
MLPINIQLFLDSLRGKTSPITEKDFDPIDIEFLRKFGDRTYGAAVTASRENKLANIELNNNKYLPQTQARLVDSAQTYQPRLEKQVGYGQYVKELPDYVNWLDAAHKSFNDPAFRISTSLGNFGMEDKGDYYRVYDKYNWNGDFDKPVNSLQSLWEQTRLGNPTRILNGLAEMFAPKVSRPVELKINKK